MSRTDDSAIDMELSQLSNVPEEPEPEERDKLMSLDEIEIEVPVPKELEMPRTPQIPRKSFADIRDLPASTSTPAPVKHSEEDDNSKPSSLQKNVNGTTEINLNSPDTNSDDSKEHPCDDCEEVSPKTRGQFTLLLAVIGLSVIVGFLAGYYIREEKYKLAHENEPNEVCVVSNVPTSLTSEQLQYQEQATESTSKDRLQEYARMMSQAQCLSGTPCSQNLTNQLVTKLKEMGFPKVDVSTYKVLVSHADMTRPSTLRTMDGDGNVMQTVVLYGEDVGNSTSQKFSSGDVNSQGGVKKRATFQLEDTLSSTSIPMYVPYSASGTAQGDLLYVHCAKQDDLDAIKDMGIDTTGKIAISRECDMMTMQQVKNVEENGMLGLILYTDPADMMSGMGMSMGMSGMYGDPLTPGCPATDGIHRMTDTTDVLPTIPVQTVMTDVASMLLSNMSGNVASEEWHGGLNITYYVGRKSNDSLWTVELEVHNTMEQQDIHNIMVTIPGTDNPDQYVMMGGHYTTSLTPMMTVDMTMSTATGSTAMMMEVAAGLADLLEDGWEPSRTVMLGLWEGAEMGNSGSMEWVEEHQMVVADRAVAYIDLDTTMGNGMITAETSPLLKGVVMDAADQLELADVVTTTTLDGMGDHVPFSHMLGVPSISLHTTPMDQDSSPVLDLDVSTTMLATKTLLLLADDPVIRYDGLSLAEMVTDLVDNIETQMASMTAELNATMASMEKTASQYMQAVQTLQLMVDDLGTTADPVTMAMLNDRLMYMEKALVMDGSSGTMRHILYGTPEMETLHVMIDAMVEDPAAMETVEEMLSVVQCVLQSATTSLSLS